MTLLWRPYTTLPGYDVTCGRLGFDGVGGLDDDLAPFYGERPLSCIRALGGLVHGLWRHNDFF
jgi:hypothetical protein